MVYERSSLRYAHTTGNTSLIYTRDGGSIVTCGSDGDIRVWNNIDDDDPSSTCLGEFVTCIAQTFDGSRLLVSTDRNTLQAYTFPKIDKDGVLVRFTSFVTCICANRKWIASGSDDMLIKVVSNDNTSNETVLEGHEGPVLALDISCKDLLASAGGDGQLKIWDLETGKQVKSIIGLAKANSFESAVIYGSPRFEPSSGKILAYVKGKEICILNTETWETQFTLSDRNTKGDYTCCQFSHNGQFIAAGTTEGEISIFDFERKETISSETTVDDCQSITALVWHPKHNKELAYCDVSGQLGTIFTNDDIPNNGKKTSSANAAVNDIDFGDYEFDNDDKGDLNENDIGGDFNDDGDDADDDADGISIERLKRKVMKSAEACYNDTPHIDEDSKDSAENLKDSTSAVYLPKSYKQQAAFQPSSTPSNLEHRYLVWNTVGIVTAHADSSDGSIDVEFHDASVHHSLHISNYNNYNMASLSSSVLALSSEGATKFVCIVLTASGNKEWSVQLPDCELVDALVATTKLVGVVTNMNFLRLFTVMGTQREVLSIPGPVIAIAGHEDRLIVSYHSSPSSENQQHISALFIKTVGLKLQCQTIPFTLPAKRQMNWLGFSDFGSPVFSDHMGLIQLFSVQSNCWYPICDTLKECQSISNNYFIIAVLERSQIIQAVQCRGCSYPMTNPRPMLQELPMRIPVCDADSEKANLEDTLARASFMAVDNSEKIVKETAIKLFALSCRSELEMRAKELIETIACPDLVQLAIKYASKLGRIHLSDRLSDLLAQLEEQRQNEKSLSNEHYPLQNMAVSPMVKSMNCNSQNNSSQKLAPKIMDISLAKRQSLKRFSSTPTTAKNSLLHNKITLSSETSEQYSQQSEITDDSSSLTPNEIARSPFNGVNPFATKRKLTDTELGHSGILFGSDKLKLAKKK